MSKKYSQILNPSIYYLQSNKEYEIEVMINNSRIRHFSESELNMDMQLSQCPVCYFINRI